jgi:threonine/homoserine/homoserine lactone efflux protein
MSALLPPPEALTVFLIAMFAVNITPGPDMLYVIGRAVTQGRLAGVVAALGIGTGCIVHIVAAALGLAAVFEHAPAAFTALKYAGAVYLVWIGVQAWRTAARGGVTPAVAPHASLWAAFAQGFVTNVLNPKVILFFLAFLPQFVPHDSQIPGWQFAALGTLFNISGTIVNGAMGLCFGAAGEWLRQRPGVWRWQQRFTGSLFVALGVRLAFVERG